MVVKYLLASFIKLFHSLPFTVALVLVIMAESTYIILDHYVIDLTPGIGTYYNGKLQGIEDSVNEILDSCINQDDTPEK